MSERELLALAAEMRESQWSFAAEWAAKIERLVVGQECSLWREAFLAEFKANLNPNAAAQCADEALNSFRKRFGGGGHV